MDSAINRAAQALTRAGQWDEAVALLDSSPGDKDARHAVAVAVAEAMVDRDCGTGADDAAGWLDRLRPDSSWAARMVRARHTFTAQLRIRLAGGQPAAEPLVDELRHLLGEAPGSHETALSHLYLGLTAEVLGGDMTGAAGHFRAVLDHGDPYLDAYALRHLSGHAHNAGDAEQARRLGWQALRLRQQCGHVTGALAQVRLLASETDLSEVVDTWVAELAAHTLRTSSFSKD